jgi:hypothetical protein
VDIIFLRLPVGIAGILAGCFGVAGAVVGMSEVKHEVLISLGL